MISVRLFADQEGVSPQAVYKLLKNHEEKLQGHIEKTKKGRFLDDYAVTYLQEHMVGKPAVVYDRKKDLEIEDLKRQLKETQDELIMKNAMLMQTQKQLIEEREERLQLEDKSGKVDELQGELNRFQPLFGSFYRKR